MRKILTGLLIGLGLSAFAVPARRVQKTIRLADGTVKEVVLKGDEFGHYLMSKDGKAYRENEIGQYVSVDPEAIVARGEARKEARNRIRAQRLPATRSASYAPANTGQKRGVVILVNFSDRKMTMTKSQFEDYFNKPGYDSFGMQGSVHDYFYDCSYGQFDLQFDIIGPINASQSVGYYGKNDESGDDLHVGELVCEVVKIAYEQGVDFSPYDWNKDGYVDQIFIIYAGFGEASGAPASTIWPHEYDLASSKYWGDGSGPVKCGNVTVNTYACSNELFGTVGKKVDGIGTACHEFSHCLGLPDMYDTRNTPTPNFAMDAWDLMDYGNYNNEGYCPTGYTSYERWFCGWLTPTVLTSPSTIEDLQCINEKPEAYLIYNDNNHNEYYLLENRQPYGWNTYDPGHGMLVLHVDYSKYAWDRNEINNTPTRQRMTIIPADDHLSDLPKDLAGDTWPGTSGNTALGNETKPAAKLYNLNTNGKRLLNHSITEISENFFEGTISFLFDGGKGADGIEQLDEKPHPTQTYLLSGQRATKGTQSRNTIWVSNGRKWISR